MSLLSTLNLDELASFVETLARQSGDLLKQHFGQVLHVEEKLKAGWVTEADKNSEKLIISQIKQKYSQHLILAEEGGGMSMKDYKSLSKKGFPDQALWLIDPLDGTTNFVKGLPLFTVSIGVHWGGVGVLGCVYQPMTGEMFLGVRGKGVFFNGQKVVPSSVSGLEKAVLATGFSYQDEISERDRELGVFSKMSKQTKAIRRFGSAALDLAYVACGKFDGFWEEGLAPWDTAAGCVLIEEAGGLVTNKDGQPFQPHDPFIVASSRDLHPILLKEVQSP